MNFHLNIELLIVGMQGKCGFSRLPNLVIHEGDSIVSSKVSYKECKQRCFKNNECNSFSYCTKSGIFSWDNSCHLKRKNVDISEERKNKDSCSTTYLVPCKGNNWNVHYLLRTL